MKEKQTRALVLWRAFRAPSSLAPIPFRVEGVVSPGEGPVSCSYFLSRDRSRLVVSRAILL